MQAKLQGQPEDQIKTYVDKLRKEFAGVRSSQLAEGAEEIQAMRGEYELVRKTLAGNPAAKVQSYLFPDVNHLVMKVEGESTGSEDGRASRVDSEIIQTIATWIRGVAGTR